MSVRAVIFVGVMGCRATEAPAPAPPTSPTPPAAPAPSPAPSETPTTADDAHLSVEYPGARKIHNWGDGHAHSVEWATVDEQPEVRAYYRRFAAQNPGYKLSESPGQLSLDGGGAMGFITVSAAPTPPDKRLHADERSVISSSRP